MQKFPSTFEEVFKKQTWKPIRNCPGRFTLAGGANQLTPAEISGLCLPVFEFKVEAAAGNVLVMRFKDNGGIISYQKSEKNFLHTLNDDEGFMRKLRQLGIEFPL